MEGQVIVDSKVKAIVFGSDLLTIPQMAKAGVVFFDGVHHYYYAIPDSRGRACVEF